jgi:hypothetical protein
MDVDTNMDSGLQPAFEPRPQTSDMRTPTTAPEAAAVQNQIDPDKKML